MNIHLCASIGPKSVATPSQSVTLKTTRRRTAGLVARMHTLGGQRGIRQEGGTRSLGLDGVVTLLALGPRLRLHPLVPKHRQRVWRVYVADRGDADACHVRLPFHTPWPLSKAMPPSTAIYRHLPPSTAHHYLHAPRTLFHVRCGAQPPPASATICRLALQWERGEGRGRTRGRGGWVPSWVLYQQHGGCHARTVSDRTCSAHRQQWCQGRAG